MLESIIRFDQNIFLAVNKLPHPKILVLLAQIFSGIERWFIWLIIIGLLIYFERYNPKIIIKFLVAVVSASYLATGIIKPIVGRLRPEFLFPEITVYTQSNNYFAFPSSHAATAFAASFVLSHLHPRGKIYFYILATLIALSRVYLGVHYPLDVFVGALLGLGVGFLVNTDKTTNRGEFGKGSTVFSKINRCSSSIQI